MGTESGDSFSIRRFRSSEQKRVRELNEMAMTPTPEYVPEIPDDDLCEIHREYLDDGEFLVGIVDETIVAMGAYTTPEWKAQYLDFGDDTAELTRMRVDPEHQQRGFGSALYLELEQRARADGYRRLVLDTGVENTVARDFYENLGFDCRTEVAVPFRESSIELALYEKPLDEYTDPV